MNFMRAYTLIQYMGFDCKPPEEDTGKVVNAGRWRGIIKYFRTKLEKEGVVRLAQDQDFPEED